MTHLTFPVRYYCMYPLREGTKHTESSFGHREIELRLKLEETALILVDVWNVEKNTKPLSVLGKDWVSKFRGGKSLQDWVRRITKHRIRPTIDVARKAGVLIIHAPTEHVAIKYEQYKHQSKEAEPKLFISDWPPPKLKEQRTRRILELRYGKGAYEADKLRETTYDDISDLVKPQPEDYIVATGEQLNQILKEKGVLNLMYVGFATNLCLFVKPGGLMKCGIGVTISLYSEIVLPQLKLVILALVSVMRSLLIGLKSIPSLRLSAGIS